MHHWMIQDILEEAARPKEVNVNLNNLHAEVLGFINSEVEELPKHGIPRPAWFNPAPVSFDDVGRIGKQIRTRS